MEWKKKINSYKMLLVIDHSGRFIFVCVSLGNNDREVYTTSPLYLEEGDFFSCGEFVAADGGFEGDGRFLCSYKNPGITIKSFLTLLSVKCTQEQKTAIKELVLGFHYLETTSVNCPIRSIP